MKKQKYYQVPRNLVLILLVASFAIPVFRSGKRENLNFWEWIFNHTIWGPPVEYLPEENYELELNR